MIEKYRITLRLFNSRLISEYVIADSPERARYQAFKYCLPLYKKARPEYIGIAGKSQANQQEIKGFKNKSR